MSERTEPQAEPWVVETYDKNQKLRHAVQTSGSPTIRIFNGHRVVAAVPVHILPHCIICWPEADATARLIAQAPALLAVCRACLLREDVADGELGDLLRAAIAAAEGTPQTAEPTA